ncbi:RNA polymerase sigma factor [Asticcacaulis solisilvae]|uniref:RNA polymerase sigma factor n=1 Tax=Asticcacaulis solisilvae TaxID=1217274 RepID=UPI003FD8A8B8
MSVQDRNAIVEDLVREYRDALTRFFVRRTSDLTEAEDLTNELFFRLIRRLNREPVENPQAFLFHAAANLVNDRHRRLKSRQMYAATNPDAKGDGIEDISPERVLEGKQALQSVMRLLDGVDKRTRDVFLLHRVHGMKYAELAQAYGISVSSVEKYIMKCLVQIAKHSGDKA